jgi:hypothetical protein
MFSFKTLMDNASSASRWMSGGRKAEPTAPRGNIHTVAEYVAVLDHYVADMDANTEFDALILRHRRVTLDHAVLNFNGAARSVDCTCELNQDAVAGPLDDATTMFRYLGF